MKFSIASVLATALAAQQAQATFLSPQLITYNINEISKLLSEAAGIIGDLDGSNTASLGPKIVDEFRQIGQLILGNFNLIKSGKGLLGIDLQPLDGSSIESPLVGNGINPTKGVLSSLSGLLNGGKGGGSSGNGGGSGSIGGSVGGSLGGSSSGKGSNGSDDNGDDDNTMNGAGADDKGSGGSGDNDSETTESGGGAGGSANGKGSMDGSGSDSDDGMSINTNNPSAVFPKSAQSGVCDALIGLMKAHIAICSSITGKYGLLASSPFTKPLAFIIRLFRDVFDKFAHRVIGFIPTCEDAAMKELANLDETFNQTVQKLSSL